MVTELHGKHYYIELKKDESILSVRNLIDGQKALSDETFDVMWHNGNQVIFSKSGRESFRGPKYHAWEKVKRDFYKIRRESLGN